MSHFHHNRCTGVNHIVDTVQCFFQCFNKGIKNQLKAPKFIIIVYVVN